MEGGVGSGLNKRINKDKIVCKRTSKHWTVRKRKINKPRKEDREQEKEN